jgi:hypothetical protein
MPKIEAARRRERVANKAPRRHTKLSGPALKAARQRRRALEAKYA